MAQYPNFEHNLLLLNIYVTINSPLLNFPLGIVCHLHMCKNIF